jgi:hypothetical protein
MKWRVATRLRGLEPIGSFCVGTNRFQVFDPKGKAGPRGDHGRIPHRRPPPLGRGANRN